MNRDEQMRLKAREFHLRNPEVWKLFCRFTFEKINAGYKHYSVRGIWHRIRWETPAGDDGKERFKLGDHHARFYGEGFMNLYPNHDGFFRTKNTNTASKPAIANDDPSPKDMFRALRGSDD